MQTAYSYQRFSSPTQVTKDKLWRQLNQARDYADRNNLQLNESLSFQDLGVSAFRGANKEMGRLGDFMMAVRHGLVEKGSFLLIESLDRLSRDTARKALRALEDICDEGITVVTLIDNQKYTSELLDRDPASLLISLVIFLRANEESETKSRRSKAGWKRRIERAKGGEQIIISRLLPGWVKLENDKMVIDQIKAKPIKMIFQLAEMGLGAAAIAKALNFTNQPTMRTAKYWRTSTVRDFLINPSVIGTYAQRYHGSSRVRRPISKERMVPNYFPRLISKKQWNKVQEIADGRRKKWAPKENQELKAIKNIFAWLARCPACGDSMPRRKYKPDEADGVMEHYYMCTLAINSDDCEFAAVP